MMNREEAEKLLIHGKTERDWMIEYIKFLEKQVWELDESSRTIEDYRNLFLFSEGSVTLKSGIKEMIASWVDERGGE